jgi:PAS domain S-box-containing protein
MSFEVYFDVVPYEDWYAVNVYPWKNGLSVYFQVITARKQAEMALRESEARFRSIFESVNDAIWILDPAGYLLQVNAVAAELLGYTREAMCGKHVSEFLSPDEAAEVSARLGHIRERGEAMFEIEHLRKDGTRLPVEVNARMADFGEERVLLSVIRDISARKQTEARLAYLNAVLRAIRNVNQLITQESDRDRLLQRACETLVETLGFHNAWIALGEAPSQVPTTYAARGRDDGLVPMTRWLQRHGMPTCSTAPLTQASASVTVIPTPSETCVDCPLAADDPARGCVAARLAYRGSVYGVLTVSIPMRYVRDTEVHALIDEVAGDLAFALWRLENEAARRQAEDALRRSERELQLTLEATTDGIWKWNFKTDALYFSPRYYTMLGYEPDAFPATYENWAGLIHPEDRAAALATAEAYLATKPDVYRNEFRMRTRDGGYRWIQTVAKVVDRDGDGEAIRMIGHHRDITARKRAEQALQEMEDGNDA